MPDIFVFVGRKDKNYLAPLLGPRGELARLMRRAVAKALNDLENGPKDVEVRLIVPDAENNTSKAAILCMVNETPDRAEKWLALRYTLALELRYAWVEAAGIYPEKFGKKFPLDDLGIWPLLVNGKWYLASKLPAN